MASKRNKLLIILGLITVAVSKSHNQRFDHDFESERKYASKPSANIRQIDMLTAVKPPATNYRGYLSQFDLDNIRNKQINKLSKKIYESDSNEQPNSKKDATTSRQMQFSRRSGYVHKESRDQSAQIDPDEFYFEPQKVKGGNRADNPSAVLFSRRTGLVIADTDKPNPSPKSSIKTEVKATATRNDNEKEKKAKNSEKLIDDKNSTKKNKTGRKKVLRVRVRNQNSNKTGTNNDKHTFKTLEKTKLFVVTTTQNPTTQKPKLLTEIKIPEAKSSTTDSKKDLKLKVKLPERSPPREKPKLLAEIKIPEVKKPVVVDSKDLKHKVKLTKFSPQRGVFQLNQSFDAIMTEQTTKKKAAESSEPEEKDRFVTFFRRSGQKVITKAGLQKQYPEPEWVSMHKTEDQNSDDNYYILSFNYMGNKHDILRIPQTTSPQKTGVNIPPHQSSSREIGKYPSAELDIGQLEKISDKQLEKHQIAAHNDAFYQSQNSHYRPESDSLLLNSNAAYNDKETDTFDDLTLDDKSYLEKQHSPTVTLKRKKAKKHKEPVWQLQSQKKQFPNDQQKQFSTNYNKQGNFKLKIEDIGQKPYTDEADSYPQRFIKQPLGDKVSNNFKQHFPHEKFKEHNVQNKPLTPGTNKGDGNYFIHMYKKMGNTENYQTPQNTGYLSSLRLSWTDDDRQARVEEAVDSRALLPRERFHSPETVRSRDDSNTDLVIPQPSENIMHYKTHYQDDFLSSLRNDKSYFPTVPIIHRHKRSAARITTHFKIGDSKVENNYTIEDKPKSRFLSKRLGLVVHSNPQLLPTPTQARNEELNVPAKKQFQKTIETYHLKPIESRGIKELKAAFNITDIFDKYQKPSRGITNIQIFQSYQTPNRDPKRAHDITYFHNDKNTKMKIQITDRAPTRRVHVPKLTLNNTTRSVAPLNNFKATTKSGAVQATDLKASYIKFENKTTSSISNQTDVGNIATEKKPILEPKNKKTPVIQSRMDRVTKHPITTTPQMTTKTPTVTTTHSIKEIGSLQTKVNRDVHKVTKIKVRRINKKTSIQKKTDKVISKPINGSAQRTTQPRTNIARDIDKMDDSKSKVLDHKSQMASTVQARRIDEKPSFQTKNVKTSTKPVTKTPQKRLVKVNTTQFIQKKGDFPTKAVYESHTTSNAEARQIDDEDWLSPQQYNGHDYQHIEQVVPHLKQSAYEKTQINNQGVNLLINNDYQQSSNGLEPQVPFHFQDPLHQPLEKNYPRYHSIPKTHFTCKGRASGYYADPETECQVFHMCHGSGVKHSFLCPNTTIFNQRLLVCDWYSKVHCEASESYYAINNYLYKNPSQEEKHHPPQARQNYNSGQNQKNLPAAHSHSENGKFQTSSRQPINAFDKPEVTEVPQFVVKHFKENIPNAEFGRPKSVSKSYSTVIAKPKSEIRSTLNDEIGRHHSKDPLIYDNIPRTEVRTPNTHEDKAHGIKSSWNAEEMEKKLEHELRTVPEISHAYQADPRHNLKLNQQQFHNGHSRPNGKINVPPTNAGKSYYVPNSDEVRYLHDNAHVAGRQNDKVIVVNRNRLNPDYDSSESREWTDSETPTLHKSFANAAHPERLNIAPPVPYTDKDILLKVKLSKPLIKTHQSLEEQKENNAENKANRYFYGNIDTGIDKEQERIVVRAPQHLHSHPKVARNNDETVQPNYGYRVEDPETIDLQNAQIFKLSPPISNDDILLKTKDGVRKTPLDEKIKWRIKEIKSGIDNIGAQVGKILNGGNDNTFKNVRIFKLKPDGSSGELEEIRLSPFKFERQSRAQPFDSQLKNEKREELEIKVIRNQPENHVSDHKEYQPHTHSNPISDGRKPEVHSNFEVKMNENTRSNYGQNTDKNVFISAPHLARKVLKDIAPKYKGSTAGKPDTAGYGKSVAELRSLDHQLKLVPSTSHIKTPREFHENINPYKNSPRTEGRLVDHNTEMRIPSRATPNKNYEIKYIPLIKIDDIAKPKINDEQKMKFLPIVNEEKSERYENIYIPKKVQEIDSSDFIFPDKIKLQGYKEPHIKTKSVKLDKLKFTDTAVNQNTKNNFDNTYKTEPVNSANFNENFFEAIPQNGQQILNPQPQLSSLNDKNKRTFVVLSKPAPSLETHSNNQQNTNKYNNYQHSNIKTTFHSPNPITQNSNHESDAECDDSVSSNTNSYDTLLFELGKNGPSQHSIQFNPVEGILGGRGNGELRSYYPSESVPKCRGKGNNKILNEEAKDSEKPSKVIFKQLKRPKYAYAPSPATLSVQKTADESIQLRSRPVKLFKIQRNVRPAFVKPATAIPVIPINPEARDRYYASGMIREAKPVVHYQGIKEIRPVGYYQGRKVGYNHGGRTLRPAIHNQERRELKPVHQNQRKVLKAVVGQSQDSGRPIDVSKKVSNNAKYAEIEKAAEMKTMTKAHEKEQKSQLSSFPAVRTEPQGKIKPQQHARKSENNSKNSDYMALEREAELKAERMLRGKNRST